MESLKQYLDAMQKARTEIGGWSFGLEADAGLALEMITRITNAYRNNQIAFGDMQDFLYKYIIEGK